MDGSSETRTSSVREGVKDGSRLLQIAAQGLAWDWRGVRGAISPVKDSGVCSSSYAFAAVAAAESAIMVERGYPVDLSEQQIVDCTFLRQMTA